MPSRQGMVLRLARDEDSVVSMLVYEYGYILVGLNSLKRQVSRSMRLSVIATLITERSTIKKKSAIVT